MNICLIIAAALSVDFGTEVGRIRPELHSSGFGPTICSQTEQDLADVKSMGFKAARTHDWALVNSGQRVCDYYHIFPIMALDAKDPKNYVFGPTDYLLKRTREELGAEVFFRLGTSIEHSGFKTHFNSLIPDDFDKVAEIFAATVRHYNRGWANGYHWNIKYWEIWNEPEGIENMWAPKEGIDSLSGPSTEQKRKECRALFVKFYVTVLRRLKDEFGDEIKVGGPALQSQNTPQMQWVNEIFTACREAGLKPDFLSWHGYTRDPMRFNREAEKAREICDSYGFTDCELHVNEWHYFGENYTWADMQRCSDPQVKARIWEGPDSHNGIRGTAFTVATLANIQRSKLDQAYYYGCGHVGSWGFKDALQNKYKVYYGLKLFGDIVRDYTTICKSESKGSITTFAVTHQDGRKGLLVVDYGGESRRFSVVVSGVPEGAKVSATLLDYKHDLEPTEVKFAKGVVDFVKPDFHSAVYFVTFE